LEGALAEAIARASNPLRVTQSVKEQFELELNRVAKEKTELEQAYLRAKTEWEQEKLKMTGEVVKLRRAAQIMGRPIPKEDALEANPKVRDLQDQLKDNHRQWNAEREQLVTQIQKLEESTRRWDGERRKLSDHAGQLQEKLTQAEARVQSLEIAARKPNTAQLEAEELKRDVETAKREGLALQRKLNEERDRFELDRRRLTSDTEKLRQQIQQASERADQASSQAMENRLDENRKKWEAEEYQLKSRI